MTRVRPGPADTEVADRLHRLLDAQRAMSGDLSLATVLDTIVRAGCDLVDARYGAVAVFDADGALEQFVHLGMDAETVARIGRRPQGHGLLGAALLTPDVVLLDDLTADPRFLGLPHGHPELRSFLGVPVRGRGPAVGELYLADPRPAHFHASDAELLRTLGSTAGAAIDNARRYDELRRSRDWLTASGAITRALLAQADDDVLLDVVSQALTVAQADFASLILPTGDGMLRVTVAEGVGADEFRGQVFDPSGSPMGKAILAAQSIRTHDMTLWANVGFDNRHGYGPAMIAPLVDAQGTRGAVLMMRTIAHPPFTPADVELASMFAAQVAVALELNDSRAETERLRVIEDRHRIARDLHDNVIQRLFAVGLGLQALLEQPPGAETAQRLSRHITDLDETIDEIRSRVFGLQDDDAEAPRRNRFPRLPTPPGAAARGTGTGHDLLF